MKKLLLALLLPIIIGCGVKEEPAPGKPVPPIDVDLRYEERSVADLQADKELILTMRAAPWNKADEVSIHFEATGSISMTENSARSWRDVGSRRWVTSQAPRSGQTG